jgi:hypothetical protein
MSEHFSDWYKSRVKEQSKDATEELEIAKELLEILYEAYQDSKSPWYCEPIVEELEGKVKADDVENVLDYLLNDQSVFPLHDWVVDILENGRTAKNNITLLDSFKKTVDAFESIALAVLLSPNATQLASQYEKIDSMPQGIEKEIMAKNFFESNSPLLENLWKEIGLKVLPTNLLVATECAKGITPLMFDRNAGTYAILLRPCLESVLKGIFYELLLIPDYRLSIGTFRKSTYGPDSVVNFLEDMKYWSKKQKISIDEGIRVYELSNDPKPSAPTLGDIKYWLIKWNIFEKIPDAKNKLRRIINELNSDTHANTTQILMKRPIDLRYTSKFLQLITETLDIVLVGVIATAMIKNKKEFCNKLTNLSILKTPLIDMLLESANDGHFIQTKGLLSTLRSSRVSS